MEFSKVRQLSRDTDAEVLDELAINLAEAFCADPFARAILGEWPSASSVRAVEFFKLQISSGLVDGEVFVIGNDGLEGVAVLFGPGKQMHTESPEWHEFIASLPQENREWYQNCNVQYEKFIEAAYGPGYQHKSSYLLILGIRQSSQNKGLGTELHRALQAKARASGVPLCWQTVTAPGFYEKLGFLPVSKVTYKSPYGNIDQWAYISDVDPNGK
ncbi:hypothetical protein C8J56DRAFT_1132237 [Mycena floridula]|nr:hypothetical protein C8J56DRAFT_1132237 [Mycena floridula]